jgi:5-oxoprolinase (ATP-hydrolysing)
VVSKGDLRKGLAYVVASKQLTTLTLCTLARHTPPTHALQVEFLRPMTAGILSERRAVAPFGLFGGQPGEKGQNLLLRADGRIVNLGGKATVALQAGDIMRISTPGAGGFGDPAAAADGGDVEVNGDASGGAGGEVAGQQQKAAVRLQAGSVHEYRRLQESA